jgi:large subunit ribosomal protein L21
VLGTIIARSNGRRSEVDRDWGSRAFLDRSPPDHHKRTRRGEFRARSFGCKAPLFGGRATISDRENRLKEAGPGTSRPSTGNEHEDNQMFAVIKTGGKQYRVAADDVITVDKVKGEPGEIIEFGHVLLLGGDSVQVGSPTVGGASVAGEVVDQARGPKVIAFKKRRRQNSRRKRGHRQEFTVVRITEILTEGRKPTARPQAEAAQPPQEASAGGAAEATVAEAAAEKPKRRAKAKPAGEGGE